MIIQWLNSDLGLTLATLPFLGVFFWWVSRVRSQRAIAEPHCRRCGYIVLGVPSARCPECGARLYPRGVAFPGTFAPLRRRTRVELWSAAVIVVAGDVLWRELYASELPHYAEAELSLAVLVVAWLAGFMVLKLGSRSLRSADK